MQSISVFQAQAFDEHAQEKLGISSLVLMENAGRSVAEEAMKMLGGTKGKGCVAIVCGVGNNGGDGLVAARHLANAGIKVEVLIVGDLNKIKLDPDINLGILKKMKIGVKRGGEGIRGLGKPDLIIDAIFGIGLQSDVREPYAQVIKTINQAGKPVLSVDVPSGLDADIGKVLGIAVKAKKTVTFVAIKNGFSMDDGPECCGELVVRDIGICI